jgi:hypothetical protein
VGARVGRSIALSSSQTQGHNITRGSLNQGVVPSWEASKRAKLQMGPLVLPSRRNGCGVAARTLTVEQLQIERRIYDPFLIVSCADGSYYIEVWDEAEFERQHTKTAGRRFLILLHNNACLPRPQGR